MAQPEPKRWGPAVLGGLMVALGGALFGVGRGGKAAAGPVDAKASAGGQGRQAGKARSKGSSKASGRPGASPRPKVGASKVRTKPRPPEAPARTRHWPPPAPPPIEAENDVHAAEAQDRRDDHRVDQRSQKLGYETEDTKAGTVAKVMVFSVSMVAISIAALFWFIGHAHRDDARSPPLTQQQLAVIVPPGPRLQDHPLHDIALERKREADLLTSYAWTDPTHRTARIPIARAQALVIGRPLDPLPSPVPAPAAPQPAVPVPAHNP